MTDNYKIGDYINKIINGQIVSTVYEIISLNRIIGGDFHDGYTISIIASIKHTGVYDLADMNEVEDYCLEYTNYMSQSGCIYAKKIAEK
jgi:hypothetical protein